MNAHVRRYAALFLCVAVLLPSAVLAQEEPHWDYDAEGHHGPAHWADLSDEFGLCGAGHAQSPVNITSATPVELSDIVFAYGETTLTVFNPGHTIQVNVVSGSSIRYNARDYQLLQFHFHHPSEHTVNGEAAPMEVHFVHRASNGDLAVVGVLLLAGDADNAVYAPIFDNMPVETEGFATPDARLRLKDLLPAERTFITYGGSLTTPPCSEGVRWLLLTEPVVLSEAQIAAFAALFELNARPVQPVNGRDVLMDVGM